MSTIYQKIKEIIKKNNYLFNFLISLMYFFNKRTNYYYEKRIFYKRLGYHLNLKNPQSFSEKVIWKKIYDRNPLLPITADKYKVRSYVKEVLGEEEANEILIPLLYVTDQPERIPFDQLPPSFIIKPNHASGKKIIVENENYNKEDIIKTCKQWLKTPYGKNKLEWAYQPIKRKIIIEELLHNDDGGKLEEFLFYMFHRKCKLVIFVHDRVKDISLSYYDENWNLLPFKKPNRLQAPEISRPENYEKMLKLAEKLSTPFDFVRVDFYNLQGKIFIGELTHYPASGTGIFGKSSYAFELGKFWKVEKNYWKKN